MKVERRSLVPGVGESKRGREGERAENDAVGFHWGKRVRGRDGGRKRDGVDAFKRSLEAVQRSNGLIRMRRYSI
jgi:hypothetical protein